jgi:ribosomal protein S12 methylthiotransferase
MKVNLVSLGCVRNLVDSELMLGRLTEAGWTVTDDPAQADVIVVNTCSFITDAANEAIDTILELAKFKQNGICRALIVVGCLPERFRENIAEAMPEVDMFLGTAAFDKIAEAADSVLKSEIPKSKCLLPDPNSSFLSDGPRIRDCSHSAYIKVAEGCSRQCTYCIIPKLRGKQRSRDPKKILAEARALVRAGVKELIPVAQDTTNYGKDLNPCADIGSLLSEMSALSDDLWIRFLYGHPESITDSLIGTIAAHPNICPYFDIPIQHAANKILKRMGRKYSEDDLYRLFDNIRKAIPDACLRTTVIVGFPGETEKEFNSLLRFIEDIRFDHLGVFMYSDADDLPSHRLSGNVSKKTAKERYDRIMSGQLQISAENNQRYLDKRLEVLVEEKPEDNLFIGRTVFQAPEVDGITYIHAKDMEIGKFADVLITDTLEYDLIGDAV